MKHCSVCSFYSPNHDACFHPSAWKEGYPFKEPGNPRELNRDYNCPWWEDYMPFEDVQPVGHKWWDFVLRFFRRFFRD